MAISGYTGSTRYGGSIEMNHFTRKNQTPYDLALEFRAALQSIKPGEGLVELTKILQQSERKEGLDAEIDKVYQKYFVLGVKYVYDLPILKEHNFHFTKTFLYWLCFLSKQNTEMFSCLFGLIATLFYHTHTSEETITFVWLAKEGMVKFIQSKDFFYWYCAAKIGTDHATVFDVMDTEEYYSTQTH